MNHGISPGLIPPRPGLEREEPELAMEDDIPPEGDSAMPPPEESPADAAEQLPRQVERE